MLGEALAGTALVLFATNIIATKAAANRTDISLGFLISVAVNVLFSGSLFAVQYLTRQDALVWNWRGFVLFALAGAFSTYLGRWFFFEAVVRFGPARASIFQISAPLFTVLIAWLVLGEQLSATALGGIALTIAGLFLVVYVPGAFTPRATRRDAAHDEVHTRLTWLKWMFRSSVLLGIGAGVSYAAGNVARGAAVHAWNEPILGGLLGASCGFLLHLSLNPDLRRVAQDLRHASKAGVLLFVLAGTLNISAQILLIFSLRYIPVSVASLITSCVPLLVIPASYLVFRHLETITWRTVTGTVIALLGIAAILLP